MGPSRLWLYELSTLAVQSKTTGYVLQSPVLNKEYPPKMLKAQRVLGKKYDYRNSSKAQRKSILIVRLSENLWKYISKRLICPRRLQISEEDAKNINFD